MRVGGTVPAACRRAREGAPRLVPSRSRETAPGHSIAAGTRPDPTGLGRDPTDHKSRKNKEVARGIAANALQYPHRRRLQRRRRTAPPARTSACGRCPAPTPLPHASICAVPLQPYGPPGMGNVGENSSRRRGWRVRGAQSSQPERKSKGPAAASRHGCVRRRQVPSGPRCRIRAYCEPFTCTSGHAPPETPSASPRRRCGRSPRRAAQQHLRARILADERQSRDLVRPYRSCRCSARRSGRRPVAAGLVQMKMFRMQHVERAVQGDNLLALRSQGGRERGKLVALDGSRSRSPVPRRRAAARRRDRRRAELGDDDPRCLVCRRDRLREFVTPAALARAKVATTVSPAPLTSNSSFQDQEQRTADAHRGRTAACRARRP